MSKVGFGLMAVILAAPVAHAGQVHTVGRGGGAAYETLQEAIDAASDGDVLVVVDQGTYEECLRVSDKDLAIYGSRAGGGSVTVQCDVVARRTLEIKEAKVRVSGLDLRHLSGGGMLADDSEVDLNDVTFVNLDSSVATVRSGAGILARDSTLRVAGGAFTDNNSPADGAGIYIERGDLLLQGARFEGGSARSGGAVYASDSTVIAVGVEVMSNTATANGGGFAVVGESEEIFIRDSLFEGNGAALGGGLYATVVLPEPVGVVATTFDINTAEQGGGIYATVGLRMVGSTLSTNEATAGDGGGLFASAPVEILGGLVDGNTTTARGGGLRLGAEAVLRDTVVTNNEADTHGGGIAVIEGKFAQIGGSVADNVASENGGGLYDLHQDTLIDGAIYSGNLAVGDGGGLYFAGETSTVVTLDGVTVEENIAEGDGGGLSFGVRSRLQARGLYVVSNEAIVGGGLHMGGISSQFSIDFSEFSKNIASLDGGGIALVEPSESSGYYRVFLSRTRVLDNTADRSGGGLFADGSTLRMQDSWLNGNSAAASGGGAYAADPREFSVHGSFFCANEADVGGGVALDRPFQYRRFYTAVFAENVARLGGGLSLGNRSAAAGASAQQYSYYLTFSGNVGGLGGAIWHANSGATPEVFNFYNSVVAGSLNYGIGQASRTVNSTRPQSVQFFDNRSGHIYNNDFYNIGTNGNVAEDPRFPDPGAASCFDLDLRNTSAFAGRGADYGNGAFGQRVYADADGDGYSIAAGDCNDADDRRYPGATEIANNRIDEDCRLWDLGDGDGDGFVATSRGGTDCDDEDALIKLDAEQDYYDGVEGDCGLTADADADGDGFAAIAAGGTDCDDTDPAIHPDAVEVAFDGVDHDCDTYDFDADHDGYPAAYQTSEGVALLDPAAMGLEADCNDADPEINPGAEEIWYDGVDQDCDAWSDFDQDFDGFDANDRPRLDGSFGDDCDDLDPAVNPDAEEIWYDGVDQDCDAWSDYDQDFDTFDSSLHVRLDGTYGDDCDDIEPTVYPEAPEILDGMDNSCDGRIDTDTDGDGVLDYYEALFDSDPTRRDSDSDGLADGVEWSLDITTHEGQLNPLDSDSDGTIDALSLDADGDGLADSLEAGDDLEAPRDSDGDGFPDFQDPDDDGDTIPTSEECPDGRLDDTDSDGTPNCLDLDSDNDGALDIAEGTGDSNGNGIPDYLDPASSFAERRAPEQLPGYGFGLGCSTAASGAGFPVALLSLLLVLGRRRRRG